MQTLKQNLLAGLFLITAMLLSVACGGGYPVAPTVTPPPQVCTSAIAARPLHKANIIDTIPEPYNGFAVKVMHRADRDICATWTSPNSAACPSADATYSAWVGYISVGGDIVQIGEEYRCETHARSFWYELGDQKTVISGIIPIPGKNNMALVHYTADSGRYSLVINGETFSGGIHRAPEMALVVVEAEFHTQGRFRQTPLANFGSITFHAVFDRKPLLIGPVYLYKTAHVVESVSATDTFTVSYK